MTTFKKDKTAIKEPISSFTKLKTTGAYTGHFTKAYEKESKSSESKAIHFEFTADTGESTGFDLWHTGQDGRYLDKNGNPLSGFVGVQELMTVLGIDDLRTKRMSVDIYDFNLRKNITTNVVGYPALLNQHIGVFFQALKIAKQVNVDGKWVAERPLQYYDGIEFVTFFEPLTGATASEIEFNKPASRINWLTKNAEVVKWPKEALEENVQIEKKAKSQPKTDTFILDDDDMPF